MKFVHLCIFLMLISAIYIPQSSALSPHERSTAHWTFMVYMDADNTLSQYAPDDLAEMMTYGSNQNISIVVLYDSTTNGDSGIYLIEKGKKELLQSLGEVDMGEESTLYNFMNWTYHNYPAQHYFLDLWDHGNNYQGICLDHGDWLTMRELRGALGSFVEMTGKKVDVIGFDACRMGSIEIFYTLKDYADYAVASEKDEPAEGWPYFEILSRLDNKNPEEAGRLVVDSMYNWAKKFYSEQGLSVILASVNLSRMDRFIERFNLDLKEALSVTPYLGEDILNSTSNVERYELQTVADFYNLMEKIINVHDYKLSVLARDTMLGIENLTYHRAWDCPDPANGYHVKNAHGMGIYFPTFMVAGDYLGTEFAKNTYWDEFLRDLFTPWNNRGEGSAVLNRNEGNITVEYQSSGDYVEIYVENSSVHSGPIAPHGEFSASLEYGSYTVFIYSYNSEGQVIWIWKEKVDYMKKVLIRGKFYLNGVVADGANITITVNNRSFNVVQNQSGFILPLNYPTEIGDNTTLHIHVQYGLFVRDYTYRIGTMKGNDVLPVIIKDTMFPSLGILTVSTVLITLFSALVALMIRRF